MWLLQLAGGCVNQETPEGKVVSAANTRCACAALPRSELGVSADLPWLLPARLPAGVLQPLLSEPGGGGGGGNEGLHMLCGPACCQPA